MLVTSDVGTRTGPTITIAQIIVDDINADSFIEGQILTDTEYTQNAFKVASRY